MIIMCVYRSSFLHVIFTFLVVAHCLASTNGFVVKPKLKLKDGKAPQRYSQSNSENLLNKEFDVNKNYPWNASASGEYRYASVSSDTNACSPIGV